MSAYKKGEFSLFPVKQLVGLTPYQQVTMAWLIHHTNTSGKCFPSLKKLVEETGVGKTKLVEVLKELAEMSRQEITGVRKETVALLRKQVKSAEKIENVEKRKAELERINRVAADLVKKERERRKKNRKGTEFDRRVKQGKELIGSAKERLK